MVRSRSRKFALRLKMNILVIVATLKQIVNSTWKLQGHDVLKLSRWIRCIFSLALTSKASDAENVLDQAIVIAENAKKVGGWPILHLSSHVWCRKHHPTRLKNSRGSFRQPSITPLTSTARCKTRNVVGGRARPWCFRVCVQMEVRCMEPWRRSSKV